MRALRAFFRCVGRLLLAGTLRLAWAFLTGLAALVVCLPAPACGPAYAPVVSYSHVSSYHAAYETPVLAAVYTPTVLTVAVPQVTVGYAPAAVAPAPTAAAPAASPCDAKLAKLEAEIGELKSLLKRPAPEPPPGDGSLPPPVPGPGPAPASVLGTSCAVCHGRTAAADGKGLRYFDDAGRLLPSAPVGKMVRAAYTGTMPPRNNARHVAPLSDEGVARLVDEIGGGPAPARDGQREGTAPAAPNIKEK